MKLCEFEAKTILAQYGAPVSQEALITNASRAREDWRCGWVVGASHGNVKPLFAAIY